MELISFGWVHLLDLVVGISMAFFVEGCGAKPRGSQESFEVCEGW